jgi:predicted Fe-Mo cluster-binding NifX family protein
MRYAISTEGDFVSAHFGRCPSFTIVDVEDSGAKIVEVLDNPGHQPGAIPRFLKEKGADCIVTGGMGARAQGFFEELNMQAIVGVWGRIDEVVSQLGAGTLRGGESTCTPGAGRGYGVEKEDCDHGEHAH